MWYSGFMAHTEDSAHHRSEAHFDLAIGERGRLVLPAQVRRRLKLHPGDKLTLTITEDGGMRLESRRQALRKLRGSFSHLGQGLVDELLAERRKEARREQDS